jgi:probable HAF family extracellular repeat protein
MSVLVARQIVATAALVLGTSSGAWAQEQYRVIDLGQSTQLPMGGARINDGGQTFYTIQYPDGEIRAYFWDPSAGATDISGSRYLYIFPQGINASGQVAGFALAPGVQPPAWFFDPQTGLQELGSLFGSWTRAFGLNDQGDVVGQSFTAPDDHGFIYPRAFIWRKGVMTNINDIPIAGGGPWDHFDTGYAISNSGVIIGTGTMGGVDHSFMLVPIRP